MSFKRFIFHPLTLEIDINAVETLSIHRKIILSKPVLRFIYDGWYSSFSKAIKDTNHLKLPIIEIGCGASYLKDKIPDLIRTDVVEHSNVDQVVNAESLPFPNEGLRAIFMVGVFHHIAVPKKFLSEAQRCLAPGGRLVMIEPTNSILHQFMIKHFHPYEYFDASPIEWINPIEGRLFAANNAMPWIVFERDFSKFSQLFSLLKLLSLKRHTFLIYYLSGGLSYRSFIPVFLLPLLQFIEFIARPFARWTGTMMTLELEKT